MIKTSLSAGLALSCILVVASVRGDTPAAPVAGLFKTHCAECHGPERLGAIGPALLPGNLGRLKPADAVDTILGGRAATQMPPFQDKLTRTEAQQLTAFIFQPPAVPPQWSEKEIRASHVIHHKAGTLPDQPAFKADPLNLFIVVETGDHHATVLDGDRFKPLHRFPTRYALHGGPKYSPDGRYVYFASRDGWVSKFDIYNLKTVAEIRAGINTRNVAVSGDGRWVMVGNTLPHTLVALDASDLTLVRVIPVKGDKGMTSRVSAVYDAAPRKSFIAALKDIKEIWELTYDPKAEPVYQGLVHDYRLGEGIVEEGPFPPRRVRTEDYLDDFFFDQEYIQLIGASREAAKGQVIDLDIGRRVATIDIPGMPHLASGITWERDGRTVLATPNLKEGLVTVLDMKTWQVIERIPTQGPGFFLRSHEKTPYAWTDSFLSKAKDIIYVIDKQSLKVVKTLRPAPGKTTAHVEFTRDGRHALVSVWEMDGAVIVYDAHTLEEITRLPMKKPSGKYNVHNKITRSSGTSH